MNRSDLKDFCNNKETIGYWSLLGGVEVKDIISGFDDFVICVSGAWCNDKSYHFLKVRYTLSGDPYIILCGHRLRLDECLRA